MAYLPKIGVHFYALFAQAFITSVRLLCERQVPLTHRLPAICLLDMHRQQGSLPFSLRFLLPMSELGPGRVKTRSMLWFPC
jgi:hypothetical protein